MPRTTLKPKLLAGGNPQIPKGDGDARVQAYIAAMPGWKSNVGRMIDAIITRAVPGVQTAVKWNSPLYGVKDQGYFLGIHCLTTYVKVGFFSGTSLRPMPPVESKTKGTRYFHIHEGDDFDDKQFAAWVKHASKLPARNSEETTTMTAMKKSVSAATKAKATQSPAALIDGRIKELGDWRGDVLATIRKVIKDAVPDVVEEWKWRGVPIWEHNGIICTGETYKNYVKMTFAKGASLDDPKGMFNSSLKGNTRRAIDVHEGEKINEGALKALVRAAAKLNSSP